MRYFIVLFGMPFIQMLVSQLFYILVPNNDSFSIIYCQIFVQQLFAIFVPVYILYHKRGYLPKKELSINKPRDISRFVFLGILLQFIGMGVNFPISYTLQKYGFSPPPQLPIPQNVYQFLIYVGVTCLTPAILEEVFFRRMMFDSMQKHSPTMALILSSFFFAMAHFNLYNFIAPLVVGFHLGLMRYAGVPLILCIITHFFLNFSACLLDILTINPIFSSLFQRYFLLIVLLALVFSEVVFSKKIYFTDEYTTEDTAEKAKKYCKKIFRRPWVYLYILLFVILGVKNL